MQTQLDDQQLAYLEGFVQKCAEAGVDPEAVLAKIAGEDEEKDKPTAKKKRRALISDPLLPLAGAGTGFFAGDLLARHALNPAPHRPVSTALRKRKDLYAPLLRLGGAVLGGGVGRSLQSKTATAEKQAKPIRQMLRPVLDAFTGKGIREGMKLRRQGTSLRSMTNTMRDRLMQLDPTIDWSGAHRQVGRLYQQSDGLMGQARDALTRGLADTGTAYGGLGIGTLGVLGARSQGGRAQQRPSSPQWLRDSLPTFDDPLVLRPRHSIRR